MNSITQTVREIVAAASPEARAALLAAMIEYRLRYRRSLSYLKRIPAFLQLWDALFEGATEDLSARAIEQLTVEGRAP